MIILKKIIFIHVYSVDVIIKRELQLSISVKSISRGVTPMSSIKWFRTFFILSSRFGFD